MKKWKSLEEYEELLEILVFICDVVGGGSLDCLFGGGKGEWIVCEYGICGLVVVFFFFSFGVCVV